MKWTDEILRLRKPISSPPLRIGIWLPSGSSMPWMEDAIERLRTTPGLDLAVAFLGERQSAASHSPVWRFYEGYNRKAAGEDNPLREIDVQNSWLSGIPTFSTAAPDRDLVKPWNLDVLVLLAAMPQTGDCRGWARYGVWSLGFGDPRRPNPAYFWEVLDGETVSLLELYVHLECLEQGRVIYRYYATTRFSLFYERNAVEPLSMAPVILIRRLLDARENGLDPLTKLAVWREGSVALPARTGWPGFSALLRLACSHMLRRARRKFLFWRGEAQWFVCLRRNHPLPVPRQDKFEADGFVPIANPPGSTLADPFLIRRNGSTYLFAEEIVTSIGRGHLIACELHAAAPGPFREILRRPAHISYPCVIECQGEAYMIPETAENRTVELHKAEAFPYQWRLEKILQQGVLLVDTTPFFHNGMWYFFTGTVEEVSGHWLETWLFHASRLDGEWTYHPRNPICSDPRRARPAGHLFYRKGKLIRPAQDCSVRYGYAIALNEVVELTPDAYEERLVEVILPDWMPGLFATHTLNFTGDTEVIDATRIPRKP
jgi:hypothetical protein